MLKSADDSEEAHVIVTFLPPVQERQLRDYGIDEPQAADLRARLRTFEEDHALKRTAIRRGRRKTPLRGVRNRNTCSECREAVLRGVLAV